jgi:hypothetical protein
MGPEPASSVPASVPASVQSGPDINELLKSIVTPIDPKLVQAATSPVPGSHAQGVPSAFTTPIAPHQDRPLDQRQMVGRKAAGRQAVANAFTGATNALGAVVTKEAQIKQNSIRDAAQKVIMAQQAIDEAKQARDAAVAAGGPDGAAQAAKMQQIMEQNQQARDAIFADPKMRKALVKGFDISYTDPQSNKTEEHAAVQEAIKGAKSFAEKREIMKAQQEKQNAEAGAGAGAAFEKSQPQGLAPNVQAQAQLAQQMAQQKLQVQAQKDMLTFQSSVYRSDRTVDAARVREIGAGIIQAQRLAFQEQQQNARFAQAEKLLGERFNDQVKLVYIHGAEARKVANEIYTDKKADPLTMYTMNRTAADKYQQAAVSAGNTLVSLQNARMSQYIDSKGNKISEKNVNQQAVRDIDAQIQLVKGALTNYQANAQNFMKQAQCIHNTFGLNESDTNADSGTSSDQSDAAGGTDYTNPLLYNDSTDDQ